MIVNYTHRFGHISFWESADPKSLRFVKVDAPGIYIETYDGFEQIEVPDNISYQDIFAMIEKRIEEQGRYSEQDKKRFEQLKNKISNDNNHVTL